MIDEDELDEVEEGLVDWPCAAGGRSMNTLWTEKQTRAIGTQRIEHPTEDHWHVGIHVEARCLAQPPGSPTEDDRQDFEDKSTTTIWRTFPRCDLGVPSWIHFFSHRRDSCPSDEVVGGFFLLKVRTRTTLGQCFFLEELNAEHNSLVTVPASLGSLQQLRELRLKHNRLENLPWRSAV